MLARLRRPASATMVADEMGLARQRVNYHLRALEKAGLSVADIDWFEINEAFAVVPLAWAHDLKIPMAKVNPWAVPSLTVTRWVQPAAD